ncbi:hypothetical protein AKJ16_DCAP06857 [Drosera capensis]
MMMMMAVSVWFCFVFVGVGGIGKVLCQSVIQISGDGTFLLFCQIGSLLIGKSRESNPIAVAPLRSPAAGDHPSPATTDADDSSPQSPSTTLQFPTPILDSPPRKLRGGSRN